MTLGLSPRTADEVNNQVGVVLRQFTDLKESIGHFHEWLLSADLKVPPYVFTAEDETLIKSAIGDLDATLDGVDMTFISRLTGMW